MEKYEVKFKKKFGQNFLKDINIVKKIVSLAELNDKSLVIEVGPGGGILTRELATVSGNVVCYEIDDSLEEEMNKRLAEYSNVKVIYKDFLDADISTDIKDYDFENLFFISNVPYYITTPIIFKLITSGLTFSKIVMMVQKEVGDRFTTVCGSKEYSSITVLLNYYFNLKKEFVLSRKNFVPEPNVDSVVVSFKNREDKPYVKDFSFFEKIVRDSFQFKRKTIRNNLKQYDLSIVESVLNKHGYDINIRAEMLPVTVFVELSNELYK